MIFNRNVFMEEEGGGEAGGQGGAGGEQGGENQVASWNYAENVVGSGDRPDWFKEKYTSVEAQAKAYGDLEKRFGGFTGAPDEYTKPEGFEEGGEASIMAATLSEIAKNSNMSQDTYNEILEGVVKNIDGYREANMEEQIEAAIKEIPNFENRRSALAETMQVNLTTDQFDGLNELMTSVKGFEAVEAIAAKLRGGTLPGNQPAPQQRSASDIMQDVNQLKSTDMRGRSKLLEELNKSGGAGKLV